MNEFMIEYMQKCISLGISNRDEICKKALSEISDIDQELKTLDQLRVKKFNLKKILDFYKFNEEGKSEKKEKNTSLKNEVVFSCSETINNFKKNICDKLEKENFLPLDKLTQLIGSHKDQSQIMMAVKSLGINNIIKRKSDDNGIVQLIPGENWDKRENI